MSDRVNKNPSIEELLSLINTLIKENEFLKFENDTLIKQNKLHIAFFDKQLLRIENMNRFNELMTVINQKFSGYIKYSDSYNKKSPDNLINADSFNNSDLSENEKNEPRNEKNEPRNEKNEPRNEKNEPRNEKNEPRNEKNELRNEKNEPRNEKNELRNEKNELRNEKNELCNETYEPHNDKNKLHNEKNEPRNEKNELHNERNELHNERNELHNERNEFRNEKNEPRNEKNELRNEKKESDNESNSDLNTEDINEDKIYYLIREKIGKKFGKKYIDKVLSRYAEEIIFIYKNKKTRVEQLRIFTDVSFPVIMRDIQFLKKQQFITRVGPHKGGHFALTKKGKEFYEKK